MIRGNLAEAPRAVGIGLRGKLDETLRSEFWAYRPPYAREACIWIHRSNERELGAPLVFVTEIRTEAVERSRPIRSAEKSHLLSSSRAAAVQKITLRTSASVPPLVESVTPRVVWLLGSPPSLQIALEDTSSTVLKLTDELTLTC